MSRTNQVCVCCEERMSCPHFDTNDSVCKKVLENISTNINFNDASNNSINWEHYHIQAAIAAMQGQLANHVLTDNMIESVENVADFPKVAANASVRIADALVAELKKGGEDEND